MKDLKKSFKKLFGVSIFITFIFLIFGLFLLISPKTTLNFISMLVGACVLLLGGKGLIKYLKSGQKGPTNGLIISVFLIILAFVLMFTDIVVSALPFIFGVIIIINSIPKVQYAFEMKKNNNEKWLHVLGMSALTFIIGIYLVFNPYNGAVGMTRVIGLFTIIYALADFFNFYILNKNIGSIQEDILNMMGGNDINEQKKIIDAGEIEEIKNENSD